MINSTTDTIVAISTAQAEAAISVIRMSGNAALDILKNIFKPNNKNRFEKLQPYRLYYGNIIESNEIIDNVLISYFRTPNSYTGEDMIEISCHGSVFIQNKILELITRNGARTANPGEFTQRSFLNGKMDLSQAEAVSDLIAAENKASHKLAMNQIKEGYSSEIKNLRDKLLKLVSLIELELDFSEEDVEFADRNELLNIIDQVINKIQILLESFRYGNVIKKGMPVVIAGKTNVGKSTLLNALLKEDRAIVSNIPGTTRDSLEDEMVIEGYRFRFTDTAGLRETGNEIEAEGIKRTWEKLRKAGIILLMAEAGDDKDTIKKILNEIKDKTGDEKIKLFLILNKSDIIDYQPDTGLHETEFIISAKNDDGIEKLTKAMVNEVKSLGNSSDIIVSNARHAESFSKALDSAKRARQSLNDNIPGDLVSQDIREVLQYLGEITGEITTDDVLGSIFKNFCIGK